MKIDRNFTAAKTGAYGTIEFTETSSEIRNPDGTIVFKLDSVEVPAGWSQVASDVIAQKYFRKAGVPARLKTVKEKGVPEFLWRSFPTRPHSNVPEDTVRRRSQSPSRCSTAWPEPGPIGAGRVAISTRGRRPRLLRRNALYAWHPVAPRRTPAVVQHRPALGLRDRRPAQGHHTLISNRQADAVAVRL